jgi:hypothetical protein
LEQKDGREGQAGKRKKSDHRYAPSLNHRIDWERDTAEWMQRGRFAAARRQFVIFCYERWQTLGNALEATKGGKPKNQPPVLERPPLHSSE